jgi:hypothetical protein
VGVVTQKPSGRRRAGPGLAYRLPKEAPSRAVMDRLWSCQQTLSEAVRRVTWQWLDTPEEVMPA